MTDTVSPALPAPETAAVVDRMYDALARGDVAAARACVTDDVVVWHSFDQVPVGHAELLTAWEQLIGGFAERSFVDVRRSPVPGGWVQRHTMVCTTASGDRVAWPLCMFFTLRDGLVCRMDEYIDRAGRYTPDAHATTTPGLPPASAGVL
ncbi:nuclear transport factor 2 family protein [Trujillonella endophytica]|uniref:Ketosteroid isomerase-related protein n=1 Tax=Trujillonella endophytica TaxID=673521 RepID=A0A1H8SW99_9ACTN|nr:nuclear transport factor 2 family protein [Trujillella endophytica]SEO82473.1 Ketosteroid isomerase-related protein [Trujillella endophytica]